MILSITFSKPSKSAAEKLGKPYIKIRIVKINSLANIQPVYEAEFFTQQQAFQKKLSLSEVEKFYAENAGTTFKNVVCRKEGEEITTLANKKGEIKTLTKKIKTEKSRLIVPKSNRPKNYILKEGTPVPFLVKLGVMTKEGKVVSSRYDKFRQINRFLEFIDDILDDVKKLCVGENDFTKERPLRIADFGCGKSYLTFTVYYFLNKIKNIPVEITGLDLKEEVINNCQKLAQECGYENLIFKTGDVSQAESKYKNPPDIMITLHACDTATDYALKYAVEKNAAAILSIPCCQHEINLQLEKSKCDAESPFASLEKWGIIQERFAALATDALRGELLEQKGYNVQMLEFIDFEGTPKNLLIRAIRKNEKNKTSISNSEKRLSSLLNEIKVSQKLVELFQNK
ncbi:MAG: SAM-dependent methyltransferase [Spirochaetales bacterium]|nr:SAM-dependent methyltransferase [Spirochaetales bacterium]